MKHIKTISTRDLKESMKRASNIRNIRFYDPLLTGKECNADTSFQIYLFFSFMLLN